MKHSYKFIIGSIFLLLLISCTPKSPGGEQESLPSESGGIVLDLSQFSNSKFELGRVEQKPFSKTLNATGSLKIPDKSRAAVTTLLRGKVGSINLIEGQWVSKGQKLFTVTNPELINLQEEYLVSRSQLEYIGEHYERQVSLSKENLVTKKDLLKAKSELMTMQARHGSLCKKLNLYGINTDNLSVSNLVTSLSIVAPISGYISQIDAMQGMYIEPTQSAVFIGNNSDIHLDLMVLEKDAQLIKKGQKLTFKLQGDGNKEYNAVIQLINRSVNEDHMISMHCHIDSEIKNLVPGMYANAQIILDKYEASALPEDAIVKVGSKHYALALASKDASKMTFEKRLLKTGETKNGFTEVIEPVDLSSEFLTVGAYYLIQ